MSSIPRSIKRTLAAGGAVLVLGGAAVGIAAAQTQPTTTTGQQTQSGYQKFIAALATRLSIDPAKLQTAIGQARTDAGFPAGNGFPGGEGRGKGGPGGAGAELQTAATFLGLQPADLRTALQTKSLTQIAADQHKSATDLANALKADANTKIDAAVTAGKVTAADAPARKTQAATRIDQLLTQVMPQRGPGGPGGPGGRGGADLQTAATFLGMQPADLRTALQTKSLTTVAGDQHKSATDLATALKNAANTRIDAAVTAGKVTAADAATQKTQIATRIDQQMTQVLPQRGPGRGADGEDPNA
ncbi:MAG TPA: hypothetical protein VGQ62_05975 [Chloroflexota bacterium]|jgi:uncharacterized protein (DUF4415 family)|nr:hypothetical protein [Chloroflexota bacterium]